MCALSVMPAVLYGQSFSGMARVDAGKSTITGSGDEVLIDLYLSQGVPYRVFTLTEPERLVLDFREVDWSGLDTAELYDTRLVKDVRAGRFRPGWSRMVLNLAGPFGLDIADMRIDEASGAARLTVRLTEMDKAVFEAAAGAPDSPGWGLAPVTGRGTKATKADHDGPNVIVLDPGHGGLDTGAEIGDLTEKDLTLSFARELKEVLVRSGGFEVILTREDDSFVSLEQRVSVAHFNHADVFISLHADSLSEGRAKGATVYTLDQDASDAASAALAERHSRDDLLAGVDLSGADDVIADVLMDLARLETNPRADLLAKAMILGIQEENLPLNNRPLREAGFSVLKSPDVPSILLELGFLSNDRDRGNLNDPAWRERMAVAITDALKAWEIADAAAAELVRQ